MVSALHNSGKNSTQIFIEKGGKEIYPSETGQTKQDIIEELLSENTQYKERVVEITTRGKHLSAEDGTEVTIYPGETQVYIFYTEI